MPFTHQHIDFAYRDNGVVFHGPPAGFPLRVPMAGLYYRGHHLLDCPAQAPLNLSTGFEVFWTAGGLDTGTVQQNNWYGVFAVKEGNEVRGKLVSFIRVFGVADAQVTCSQHFDKANPQVYGFSADAYRGRRYVVLTGPAAGRTGTVAGNSDRALTLTGDTTGLSQGSWLMVGPAGYDEYSYLGSILRDTGSPKNFYKYRNRFFSDNNTGDVFAAATAPGRWYEVDVLDKGFAPPTARVVRVWAGVQYDSPTPFWFYFAADGSDHRLSWWTCPPHGSVHGATGEVPVEFSGGKFYFQADQPTRHVQMRLVGYDE